MEPGVTQAHTPLRPSWACAACGLAWPCETSRESYAEEYRGARISLGLAMASCLDVAMSDLPKEPAAELYTRFLGWLRR